MKFLLDSCISNFAVKDLKEAGLEVLWILDLGKDPGDEAIIKKAFDGGFVLITAALTIHVLAECLIFVLNHFNIHLLVVYFIV